MHSQRLHWLATTLGAALLTFTAAGCDAEGEFEDDLAVDELAVDELAQDDVEFRSAGDYYDPVGTHDVANCSTIAGWAKDGDSTDPTQVHIYKGAPFPSGQIVTHVWADDFRGDLPGPNKNHGFSISTPAAFKTGCPEKVYIHAIDLDANGNFVPGGNNLLISQTGKTVTCGPPPPGGCDFGGPGGPFTPE